jgi:hypothetical protein
MTRVTLERDGAARLIDDGFADGQPEAGAAGVAAARRIAAREALKDVGQERGVDTIALVFDT